jgi:hypothetical protein
MIQVLSDDPDPIGAQVTVHGSKKQISFELAALAAQLVRHNYSREVIMESVAFGMANPDTFKEE